MASTFTTQSALVLSGRGGYNAPANFGRGGYNAPLTVTKGPDDDDEAEDGRGGYN
jgi:hypothetical protein